MKIYWEDETIPESWRNRLQELLSEAPLEGRMFLVQKSGTLTEVSDTLKTSLNHVVEAGTCTLITGVGTRPEGEHFITYTSIIFEAMQPGGCA